MIKNTIKRGFTLIELLVVIAIIGILASVVLASLNTAREKGEDGRAKSQISSARAEAEIAYDDDGDYSGACAAIVAAGLDTDLTGYACGNVAGSWAAEAALNSGTDHFCADSTGASAVFGASSGLADTVAGSVCDGA